MARRIQIALAALLLLAGCGGFDNETLTLGAITGRMLNPDRQIAYAGLMGEDTPEWGEDSPWKHQANVDNDGSFKLDRIYAGTYDVLLIISATKTARITTTVKPGELSDLADIAGEDASGVRMHLVAPGGQRIDSGTAWLHDYPGAFPDVDDTGVATVNPCPSGCYDARAVVDGLGLARVDVCMDPGELKDVDLVFAAPDGSSGHEGCVKTGCTGTLVCGSDGNCH